MSSHNSNTLRNILVHGFVAWRVVSFESFGGVVVLTFGGDFVDKYVGASYF